MANVNPIPRGYHSLTPYLFIKGAAGAIDFYKTVFGATERMRMPGPDGRIMHAELQIGDSIVMLSDENPQMGALSPQSIGGTACGLNVYLADVDAATRKALELGAKLVRPVRDQFYGDRSGSIIDPFGHLWSVATHIEDVAPEEMQRRMAAAMGQAAGA
ncbi:MAG: VOC family protein [Candidatus Acidiferrales bacterium]